MRNLRVVEPCRNRRAFSGAGVSAAALAPVIVVVALCALQRPAAADTYLSVWDNRTTCDYVIKNNGPRVILDAGTSRDLGALPSKNPDNILVGKVMPYNSKCDSPDSFRVAVLDEENPKTCPGLDIGPNYVGLFIDGKPVDRFCYCIRFAQVAYISTMIGGDASHKVVFKHGPGTYKCP